MSPAPSITRRSVTALGLTGFFGVRPAHAAGAASIAADAQAALDRLLAGRPAAREWSAKAKQIIVFPSIIKAGAMIGGESGDGAAFVDGQVVGFYNISAASFGFQLGAQTFSYALFMMTPSAVDYLQRSGGWAVGTGPSLVIVDEGFAKSLSTTTLTQDVYAVAFGQQGLMAGTGLEGSKITRIYPDP